MTTLPPCQPSAGDIKPAATANNCTIILCLCFHGALAPTSVALLNKTALNENTFKARYWTFPWWAKAMEYRGLLNFKENITSIKIYK
jgi:hypothetical protein